MVQISWEQIGKIENRKKELRNQIDAEFNKYIYVSNQTKPDKNSIDNLKKMIDEHNRLVRDWEGLNKYNEIYEDILSIQLTTCRLLSGDEISLNEFNNISNKLNNWESSLNELAENDPIEAEDEYCKHVIPNRVILYFFYFEKIKITQ